MFEKFPKPLKKEFRYIRSKLGEGSGVKSDSTNDYELAKIYNRLKFLGLRLTYVTDNSNPVLKLDVEKDGTTIQQIVIDGTPPVIDRSNISQIIADKNVKIKIGEDIDISSGLADNEYYQLTYREQNHTVKHIFGKALGTLSKGFFLATSLEDNPLLNFSKIEVDSSVTLTPVSHNITLDSRINEDFKYSLRAENSYESRFINSESYDTLDSTINVNNKVKFNYSVDLTNVPRGINIMTISRSTATVLRSTFIQGGRDYTTTYRTTSFFNDFSDLTVKVTYRQ